MGKIAKGVPCSVEGCNQKAERSISRDKATKIELKLNISGNRAYLCKDHWKELKKKTKKDRRIEKWMWRR